MIEIFLLIWLCGKMGLRARSKGLSPTLYQFFVVLAWFGGQVVGAVFTFLMCLWLLDDFADDDFLIVYFAALFMAGVSVWFVFKLVAIKRDIRPTLDEFDDDDESFDEEDDLRMSPRESNRGDDRIIGPQHRDREI